MDYFYAKNSNINTNNINIRIRLDAFEKGNKWGELNERNTYQEEQLKEMREMLTSYLQLVKKVLVGKSNVDDYAKLTTIGADMRKILDKLHASKTETKIDIDKPILIISDAEK